MKSAFLPKRFIAFCIDYIILTLISFLITFVFLQFFGDSSNIILDSAKVVLNDIFTNIAHNIISNIYNFTTVITFFLAYLKPGIIIHGITIFLYFTYFEQSKWQATPGKNFLDLQVKTSTKKPLSCFRAIIRNIFFITPALFFYFIVFSIYPECLNILNISFYILGFKIAISQSCIVVFVSYVICYLLWFIPIFFTKNKTTIYDILSNSLVLER